MRSKKSPLDILKRHVLKKKDREYKGKNQFAIQQVHVCRDYLEASDAVELLQVFPKKSHGLKSNHAKLHYPNTEPISREPGGYVTIFTVDVERLKRLLTSIVELEKVYGKVKFHPITIKVYGKKDPIFILSTFQDGTKAKALLMPVNL